MKLSKFFHTGGFTLVEIMIVISMIMILMGITMFPYSYYMDRSRVEKESDMLSQEWILAHSDVKNGILYDGVSLAHLYFSFHTGSNTIDITLSTGGTSPQKIYKTLHLENGIEIQSMSGAQWGNTSTLIYHISPPYGMWRFSTGWGVEFDQTGILLRFGYRWATIESGRAREILLRPYY